MSQEALADLASTGVLRAGINLANPLLVTGRTDDGDPVGVAPDMARELATRLGVEVVYVPFPSPGALADEAESGWDVGFIAAEPKRAETIDFTAAYVEIEATYLVPKGSPFKTVEEVDSEGTRIAVSARAAYDLYLTRSLKHAELVRGEGLPGAVELMLAENLDALAGLRPALLADMDKVPGSTVLDGSYTTVQQAAGTKRSNVAGAAYLKEFIEDAKASGLVASFLDKHGVTGKLSVAPAG